MASSGTAGSSMPINSGGGSTDGTAGPVTAPKNEESKKGADTNISTTASSTTASAAPVSGTTATQVSTKEQTETAAGPVHLNQASVTSSSTSAIGIQKTAQGQGEKTGGASDSNITASATSSSDTMAAQAGSNNGQASPAGGAGPAKSPPVNSPAKRPPSAGTTSSGAASATTAPTAASTSTSSAATSNQSSGNNGTSAAGNARSPALAATSNAGSTTAGGSGTASPGYKPFDYSQPLSTYSPAGAYGSGMRRSPVGTPVGSANASPNSNPIAAGFAYGATGQRTGSGLNPQNSNAASAQKQQQVGSVSPGTAANRQPPTPQGAGVQSRTGNNATPLTAPSIVSRTSGSGPSGSTATAAGAGSTLSSAAAAEIEGIATSAAALANQSRIQSKSPIVTNVPAVIPPPPRSGQPSQLSSFQTRYGHGHFGNQNALTAANAPGTGTRDPRTPNPVTESLLSRSPVSSAAGSPGAAGNATARPPSNPSEQSRTGGIATPLAPASSATTAAGGTGIAGARPGAPAGQAQAASPSTNATGRESPGQKPSTQQSGAPVSASLSWRSLIDRPYPSPYGNAGGNQAGSRTQSPSQRSGLWFNPLAVKQQSSAQAQQQAQAQAQAQAVASGQRASSAAASPAGSPQQSTVSPSVPPTTGTPASAAQTQANKRRTHSTSAATPPYNMSAIYGNRPGTNSAEGKDGAQPPRAVTASPVVGAAGVPTPSSAPAANATPSAAGTGKPTASPGHQHRPSYSMTYGERLQQLQAQTVRDREREREAREREMREREKTAAAIAAGPKTSQGSPPLSIARSPYYGMTSTGSSVPSSGAGKAASPPASATAATSAQGPLSPPRKAADRPSSTSAFGYLFGGGGASRVATEGGASQAAKAAPPGNSAAGVTAGGVSGQGNTQQGHYRTASNGTAQSVSQQQQQQQQQAAAYRQGLPGASAPVSRTQNTGLGLSAQANWRAQGYNGATGASTSTGPSQTAPGSKPESSPQLAAQQAVQKGPDTTTTVNGHKRKYSDAQENVAPQSSKQAVVPSQPPPATLHALRQREGPLFTAEDIKGAALRPPLMIVRSDNVVKALHKLSAQHHAASPATSPPSAPFLGRVIYDPFIDPAKLLDADLLRKGVGGKVEIWLDTEWLKGEIWEAGAPSHPAVSHPPSPVSEDLSLDEEPKSNGASQMDGMQVDDEHPSASDWPNVVQRREDLPPSWTLWDLVPLKERKIWGTDVYTDDSDILAACIHSGWLRLGSTAPLFGAASAADEAKQKRRRRKKKPTLDHRSLKITIVVAPKLIKYEGSLRAGVWSRSWGNSHDGVSYAIESVELVEKARHRLTPARWKTYDTSFTELAKQRCSCTMGCEHVERPTLYPRSLKLGEVLVKAS